MRLCWQFPSQRPYQSRFEFTVIDQMKRQQKLFSVEIKKSRTPGQRYSLPPRHLFAAPPAATSAFLQTAEYQADATPVTAPRILPSIIEAVTGHPEPVEPVRRKRMATSKDTEGQIELDLPADEAKDPEGVPETPSALEPRLQMDAATTAEESIPPVPEVWVDDVETGETKARTRRKKLPELIEPVEASALASQPSPAPEANLLRVSASVTSSEAIPSRLSKRQAAAAQLPRSERWKRRLHSSTW
jgi:hypothetical protein